MTTFIFSKYAERRFLTLQKVTQERVLKKLVGLKQHANIFAVLKKLNNLEPATHRLRIGDLRLILELKKQSQEEIYFLVLDIGDRKNIYK